MVQQALAVRQRLCTVSSTIRHEFFLLFDIITALGKIEQLLIHYRNPSTYVY